MLPFLHFVCVSSSRVVRTVSHEVTESGEPKRKLHSKAGRSSGCTSGEDGSSLLTARSDGTATVSQLLLLLGETEFWIEFVRTDDASLTVVTTHDDAFCWLDWNDAVPVPPTSIGRSSCTCSLRGGFLIKLCVGDELLLESNGLLQFDEVLTHGSLCTLSLVFTRISRSLLKSWNCDTKPAVTAWAAADVTVLPASNNVDVGVTTPPTHTDKSLLPSAPFSNRTELPDCLTRFSLYITSLDSSVFRWWLTISTSVAVVSTG